MKKILAVILMLFMVLHPMPFAAAAEEAMQEHEKELSENAAPVTEESTEEAFPGGPEQVLENPTGAAETDAVPEPEGPNAASAPTKMWLEPSERNGIPSQIDVFVSKTQTGGTTSNRTYTYTCQLYLPGNAVPDNCFLSWDGGMQATVGNSTADSGSCPIPAVGSEQSFSFRVGSATYVYRMTTLQGAAGVTPVFIEIDESNGNPTIAQMDGDADHNVTCTGDIWIDGMKYELSKMKGRGNATWKEADDKKPYNVTLGKKINFPGVDSEKTKKWSFLAENLDRSLLGNRAGYWLAYEMGIGQDTASADVWMNGEYQGCYTVTPKTDSYVTKTGYMIEQDNYLEASVADGGDPQFQLDGLKESSGWSSAYNRITVKKMGDDLLGYDANGEVNESAENMEAAAKRIQAWLQDAWDAIRSDTGYNAKGKYYTDYIDIESFAKMYLMHEYVKSYDVCAGSILYHRDGQTDDDKLIAGPLWDLDNAMGSTYNNTSLGRGSDRRSGQGSFIPIITEYKTSVYKTISKHSDFMEEVYRQYNRYRSRFDALSDDFNEMAQEIESSALMNFRKVNDLGNGTGKNNHYYGSQYTTGSGQYAQTYVKTTQWQDYVTNMDTYITTRSLWFYNTYYDSSYVCEHQYRAAVTDPTCKAEGTVVYSCIYCGDSYTESLPKIAHDYQNGVCTGCGEVLLTAAVVCGTGASVTVYETQDTGGACMENAVSAHPRNSDTGMIDCGGGGQINFAVTLAPGYELTAVTAEPASAYKNLKGPADTGVENGYRLTEVKGDLTITVTAQCTHDYQAVVTLPTCTEDGYTTWTCKYCGDSYVDAIVPAMGHAWGIAAYEWAEDNGSVTATRVCAHDAAHVETETVKTTSEVTKPAACEEKGETTYTAVFANKAFKPQTKAVEDIPAMGHTLTAHAAAAATCTEAGSSAWWSCSVCGRYFSDEEGKTEIEANSWVIPATGHDYKLTGWTWAEDHSGATATFTCANDPDHTETVTAVVTSETTAATAAEAGRTVYTATVTFEGETYTDTAEVILPILDTTYTLTYDANGGEGAPEAQTVTNNTLSAEFTVSETKPTREGFTFRGWARTADAEEPMTETGVTLAYPETEVTLYAVWEKNEQVPEFKVQNLVLSGQIGVNFFLDLSMLTEAEREASYMEFSIDGKGAATAQDPFDANHMNGTKKYYGFTFYVNSIQMADTITATFHYGNGKTVSRTYSVEEYFETFDQHAAENTKQTVDLVHAIADYGHYMQLYLASVNGFTLGTDYAELTRHYTDSYDWADILSKVESHAIARSLDGSNVEKANYRLQLGSETTLDVFLKTTDGSAPTDVTVTIREEVTGTTTTKAYTPEKQADGRYLVTIPNISAHKLGDKVTITGNAGGSFTVVASPLSFVRDVLTYEKDAESRNGLSSLYAYYGAAAAFLE